ncbi:hypothetical protein BDF21DRAFT_317699, partial [Thamnidium elegans]
KGSFQQGGIWKPQKHSLYTSICAMNENNTSRTCHFCSGKLFHPTRTWYNKTGKKKIKSVNGSFICYSKECVLVLAAKNNHGRDSLSTLVIGLSGFSMLMFGITYP